jgi:tetratricopeptide (TPR) repeat protein
MENEMLQLTSQPPFTGQCDHAQRRRQLQKRVHELNRAATPAAKTESLAAYRRAVSADPDDLLLRQKLARLLLSTGDPAAASQQYEELLSRLPDNGVLLLVSVPPLLGQKKIAEADARFEQGLRRAANPLNVYLGLAPAYAQAGLPDKAVWCYQEALKIAPNSATVHGGLGKVLAEQKRFPEAVAEYLKAVELDPSNAEMHCSLGVALLEKAELAAALPHLLKAAELDPFSARAHEYLAAAFIAQGRKSEALDHLGQAVRLDEFSGQLRRRYARALHREGQFSKAAEEYRQVVQLAFQPTRARGDLAWLLATCPDSAVRNVPQAVELAEEANRIAGGRSGPVLDILGAAYAAAGRFDQAVPLTTAAMESANRGGQTAMVAQMQQRLELYRRNQPFLTSEPYPSGD